MGFKRPNHKTKTQFIEDKELLELAPQYIIRVDTSVDNLSQNAVAPKFGFSGDHNIQKNGDLMQINKALKELQAEKVELRDLDNSLQLKIQQYVDINNSQGANIEIPNKIIES